MESYREPIETAIRRKQRELHDQLERVIDDTVVGIIKTFADAFDTRGLIDGKQVATILREMADEYRREFRPKK